MREVSDWALFENPSRPAHGRINTRAPLFCLDGADAPLASNALLGRVPPCARFTRLLFKQSLTDELLWSCLYPPHVQAVHHTGPRPRAG